MYDDVDPARGAHIAALRAGRLMTQASLATAAGLHVATVRRAEAGKPLSTETAQGLCAVLDLPAGGLHARTPGEVGQAAPPFQSATTTVPPGSNGTPERRWMTAFHRVGTPMLVACALGVAGFEWTSWASAEPSWFRILQAGAQTCLALAFCVLAARGVARKRTGARAAALVLVAVATAWPTAQVLASMSDTAWDISGTMLGYSHARTVIRMRSALDPSWDRAEAEWDLVRILSGKFGHTSAYLETPGAFAWHLRRAEECRDLYLHAEVYPKDVCSPPMRPIPVPLVTLLWQSVVGGSFVPPEFRDTAFGEAVEDGAFAEAKAMLARVRHVDDQGHETGSLTEAEAFAEARKVATSRRDRQGPGG